MRLLSLLLAVAATPLFAADAKKTNVLFVAADDRWCPIGIVRRGR